eukprot:COSAG05_NODE_147_length_16383_cov_266.102555_11_plen_134_part_00
MVMCVLSLFWQAQDAPDELKIELKQKLAAAQLAVEDATTHRQTAAKLPERVLSLRRVVEERHAHRRDAADGLLRYCLLPILPTCTTRARHLHTNSSCNASKCAHPCIHPEITGIAYVSTVPCRISQNGRKLVD